MDKEAVRLDVLMAHGGLFKVEGVAQKLMAGALKVPVAVMESAGEGGPWGMALLAAYSIWNKDEKTLEEFLEDKVFGSKKSVCVAADEKDISGFEEYMRSYRQILAVERCSVENLV